MKVERKNSRLLHLLMLLNLLLLVVCGLLVLAVAEQAQAQERAGAVRPFEGDGYYWYRDRSKPQEQRPPEPQPAAPESAKPETPAPLSVEWLKENLPRLHQKAIDSNDPEDALNYQYAKRVMLDKAQNFSETAKNVSLLDPFLDENNRVPISQYASRLFELQADADREEILRYLAERGGIWVFTDDPKKCGACERYVDSILLGSAGLPGVVSKYKFSFRRISVGTSEGRAAAKNLNLKLTPTTVLVVPPDGFYLVSQGLLAKDQLEERILIAAKVGNLLPADMASKATPYSKGVMSTQQMQGMEAYADPSDVMREFRRKIKGEYQ